MKYDKKAEKESKTKYGMFHTSQLNGYNKPERIFDSKKEIIDELSPTLKQSDFVHIDEVCNGKRKNVKEFRFFHIIDGQNQIKEAHREKPNKVIYRVRCIDDNKIYKNAKKAALAYGLSQVQISAVCRGEIRKTGGKIFESIDWLDRSIAIQKELSNLT